MIGNIWRTVIALTARLVKSAARVPTSQAAPKRAELKTASPTYERDKKRAQRAKKPDRKVARSCPDVSRDMSRSVPMCPDSVPGHVPMCPDLSRDNQETPETPAHLADAPPRRPRLSLSKNQNLNLEERESGKGGAGERGPLPPDWQPDDKTRQFAIDQLGDAGAVDLCFEKFRVHHETSDEQWTPKAWQSRARGYVLKEKQLFGRQLSLRLLRDVGGRSDSKRNAGTPVQHPPEPEDPVWTPVRQRLVAELTEAVVVSWFRGARLDVRDGTATLALASNYMRQRVENDYAGHVTRAVAAEHAGVTGLRFVVDPRIVARKEAS